MRTISCENCNQKFSLSDWKCRCEIISLIKPGGGLLQFYSDLYASIAEDDMTCHLQDSKSLEAKAIFDFSQIEKILREKASMKVLEIGPGKGHLASKLMKVADYYCMDIVSDYLSDLQGKKFLGNIENAPNSLYGVFDLIIVCDVLEHVLNEGNAMEELNRLLTKDGTLYLRVPNKEPLIHYATFTGTKYPFVHLRSYSKLTIKMNSYAHNFSPQKIGTINFGKYSYSRRNFGLGQFYRKNAKNLRNQLIPSGMIQEAKQNKLKKFFKNIFSMNFTLNRYVNKIYTRIFFRGTEIYGILKKNDTNK
jgi:SAM-dependent methyltransferase